MARRIDPAAPAHAQLSLTRFPLGAGWHVWIAAGDIAAMVMLAEMHGATTATPITFARIGSPRLRTYTLGALRRRLFPR